MRARHNPAAELSLPLRPLELPGGRSRRRLVCFSPKLERRVVLGGYDARKLWLALEANPLVTSFCERPRRLKDQGALLDFWVQFRSGEEEYWWLSEGAQDAQAYLDARRIRTISPAQLTGWAIPLANWDRLVAIATTWRGHRDALLEQRIVVLLGVPGSLASLAEALPEHPSEAIEAAVAHLLASGRVVCPELATELLSDRTPLRRA